ncbi:unnamed protein product [Rhizoctonia solani]|uniref:NACHT domain-containing protein n=1 Tax=Rhizoctonia solani TaxID=456999 RepID=A0A8H3DVM8_9AGAM|nr:unnamed protein product [Rhizoctonia solani]
MSSPPSTPKPRNRLQQFLKDPGPFTRSRSRSQSASPSPLPYLDPSPATGPRDKGAGPLTSSNTVTLPVDKTAVGTSVVDSSAVRLGQQPVSPNSISANAVSPSLAPVDSCSGPLDTVSDITTGKLNGASPRLLSLGPEHALCSGILPESAAPRNTIMLVPGQKIRNAVWDQLRVSLQFLRNISTRFPQFDSAIESLLSCLDGFEGAVRNRQDYEDLATELTVLSESLGQHIEGLSFALMSHCVVSIVMSVQRQVEEIQDRLRQTLGGSIREAALVMHYRQIQAHFRLLEKNANMSTWRPVDEQLENTRLEGLRPAREATYDSSLSTVIGRRTCTEGTRTTVLADLEDWLYDPTALPIYWMNGMAGTGKTTIMSTFCKRAEHPKLLAASFFCTRSSAECRDVTRIVPTIAYQLAQYSIPFRSHLCQILGQNLDTGSKNLLKQFEQLLLEPLKQSKDSLPEHLVVVIDALDECENRAGVELILDILLRSVAEVPLKFLITSRPEPEIYERLIGYSSQQVRVIHLHEIKNSLVQADIELYLTEELGFISPDSTDIEQLVKRSGYLFIYAATLVRYILGGKRLANPRKRLKWVLGTTPEATKVQTHIDALYTAVLRSALSEDETEPDKVEDIRAVLRTVLSAQEPISVETIATLAGMSDPQRAQFALLPLRAVLHQTEVSS